MLCRVVSCRVGIVRGGEQASLGAQVQHRAWRDRLLVDLCAEPACLLVYVCRGSATGQTDEHDSHHARWHSISWIGPYHHACRIDHLVGQFAITRTDDEQQAIGIQAQRSQHWSQWLKPWIVWQLEIFHTRWRMVQCLRKRSL
jgi:hypothetical protein